MTFFFQRKNPLKPVDFIFSSNNTPSASMDIATSVLLSYYKSNNENENENEVDTSNTYTDLEIFNSISNDTNSVVKSLDKTYTFMGRSKLNWSLENPISNISMLKSRQKLVKELKSSNRYNEIVDLLSEDKINYIHIN